MKKTLLIFLLFLQTVISFSQELNIYGYDPEMRDYTVFLGKLNAESADSTSIWNTEGQYGDKKSHLSIWNASGAYGSATSDYSPFNEDADYPPQITDEENNRYGYFTTDINRRQRCTFDLADVICKYHLQISVNIQRWYNLIFGKE